MSNSNRHSCMCNEQWIFFRQFLCIWSDWKSLNEFTSNSGKLSGKKFHNCLACEFTAQGYAWPGVKWPSDPYFLIISSFPHNGAVTSYQQLPLSGHNHAKGNLFVFILAAPACSKRSIGEDGGKKSDGVGAGRERVKFPYTQTRLTIRNSKNREPLGL